MRFSRDKRGYENTFVVHSARRRGNARSRVLYWFRTPPGVRVGRAALDEDAIRLLEEHNPEIEFDWTQILRGGPEVSAEAATQPASGRQQSRRQRPSRGRPASPPAEQPTSGAIREVSSPQEVARLEPQRPDLQQAGEPDIEPLSLTATLDEDDATLAGGEPVPAGGMDDFEPAVAPQTAAGARLGSEGLLRLRARYAEVLARISERISDPARQEELKAQAERLNPDTWVTDQEVRDGLEQYEAVFDSLRAVVGRKRTRRRWRRAAGTQATGSAGSGASAEVENGPDASGDKDHEPGGDEH